MVYTPQKMPLPHVLKVLCLQVDFETNENHKNYSVGVTAGLTQVRMQPGRVWGCTQPGAQVCPIASCPSHVFSMCRVEPWKILL